MTAREFLDAVKARVEDATEGPWTRRDYEFWGAAVDAEGFVAAQVARSADLDFIVTARTAVPRLVAALEAVVAVHRRSHAVFNWALGVRYDEPCPECDGKAGVHPCGCWADSDVGFVCAECHRLGSGASGVYDYAWPCPTVRAIESALGGDEG